MKIFKSKIFITITIIFLILFIRHIINENNKFWTSNIEYVNIEKILSKTDLTTDDLNTIFEQTGISPTATLELIKNNKTEILRELNNIYLKVPEISEKYTVKPFTIKEYLTNQKTPMADIKNGDVLINMATSTLDWRHGHAALVVDVENNQTLEHSVMGDTSYLAKLSNWRTQSKFILLRYEDEEVANQIAEYAKNNLVDIKYDIFTGIINKKDQSKNDKITNSHCSHIVWQAYKTFGIDIDENGGPIVLPQDIANSSKLKVVQIYGINTKEYKNRLY